MYPILLIKLVDKVSVYQPESSNDSYGELNDLGDATWKCHVIIFILIEHMEKNTVQNITSMSVILVQKIVRFLILWNIGKNFVENFITKQRVFLFTNQLTHTNFYIIYMQNNGWPSKRVVTLIISDNFEVYMSWMSTVRVVVFASGKLWYKFSGVKKYS